MEKQCKHERNEEAKDSDAKKRKKNPHKNHAQGSKRTQLTSELRQEDRSPMEDSDSDSEFESDREDGELLELSEEGSRCHFQTSLGIFPGALPQKVTQGAESIQSSI